MSAWRDTAVPTRSVGSNLDLSPDSLSGPHRTVNPGIPGETALPLVPDEGWTSDPSASTRIRPRPRSPSGLRPASPRLRGTSTVRPLKSKSWGPGDPGAARAYPLPYRPKSPTHFQRVSRSISPKRTLASNYHCRGLLQEVLQYGTPIPFVGTEVPRFQERFSLPFVVQGPWSGEEPTAFYQNGDGKIALETLGGPTLQGTDEDHAQEDSDDSFLDELDQEAEPRRLDANHHFWSFKDPLTRRAQALLKKSYQSISEAQNRPRHLVYACPFFRKDPTQYSPCLADTSMTTISEVKRHLSRHHTQPHYCPVCYETFRLASEKEAHILQRTCQKREVTHVEGMTPEQKALISEKCKGERPERWCSIWRILFGRPLGFLEPFLPPVLSSELVLVKEFWEERGRDITEEFLRDMGVMKPGSTPQEIDQSAVLGLANAVLEDLAGSTFWASGLDHGLRNTPKRYSPSDSTRGGT